MRPLIGCRRVYDVSIVNPKSKGDKARMQLNELVEKFGIKNVKIIGIDCTGMRSQIGTGKFNLMLPKPKSMYRLDREIRSSDVVYQISMNPVLLMHAVLSAKLYGKRFILGLHNPIILKEEGYKEAQLAQVPEHFAQDRTRNPCTDRNTGEDAQAS